RNGGDDRLSLCLGGDGELCRRPSFRCRLCRLSRVRRGARLSGRSEPGSPARDRSQAAGSAKPGPLAGTVELGRAQSCGLGGRECSSMNTESEDLNAKANEKAARRKEARDRMMASKT